MRVRARASLTRRVIDRVLLGYGAAEFFADFFTGGVLAPLRLKQNLDPETGEPMSVDQVRDVTQTAAYKAAVARGQAAAARGATATEKRKQALEALKAIRSQPLSSSGPGAGPIAINVPSFALGGRSSVGLAWDKVDTGLTIANPAYGLYRLFGGKGPTSGQELERGYSTDSVRDVTQTAAYQAGLLRDKEAEARGLSADKARAEALQALAQVRSAPVDSVAPHAIEVPSFLLGHRGR